jgi:hypothetical protein
MDLREQRTFLASAPRRDEHAAFVRHLQEADWPPHALQLIGDGLLVALGARAEGATVLAARCADQLRERDWTGDAQLAAALAAARGDGPVPALRRLPVPLDDLASVLEGDPVSTGGRINLTSGDVWPQVAIEYAEEMGELEPEEEGWLWVEGEGSRAAYRDMVLFTETLTDPDKVERLRDALDGRGAFRRFRNVLSRWSDDFTRWHFFSDDRQRGRARAWLADRGYTPDPRRA